jgi:hypothetical protein
MQYNQVKDTLYKYIYIIFLNILKYIYIYILRKYIYLCWLYTVIFP